MLIFSASAAWSKFYDEEDEARKQQFKEALTNESLPQFLAKFNEILEENKSGTWLIGKSQKWVDFVLANLLEVFEDTVDSALLEDFSALKNLKEKIFSLPEIKNYISSGPETTH
jgi:glutathione S-transferase